MPTYEYRCETNGRTLEVSHSMRETIATWGELCDRVGTPGPQAAPPPARPTPAAPAAAWGTDPLCRDLFRSERVTTYSELT